MNSQNTIYKNYCDKFYQANPKIEYIKIENLRTLECYEREDENCITASCKINSSGNPIGVYLLSNNTVIEVFCECGSNWYGYQFKSKKDWENYKRPMPMSTYFEF